MTERFSSVVLQDWLQPLIRSGAKVYVDRIPETGRVVFITMQPGAGLEMEGLLDTPAFNVQCRGADNNYEDAERIALEVDSILLEIGGSGFQSGDVVVQMMNRSGGSPQQISAADNANRFIFSCNYYARVFTNIGGYT
jgi:hypothetical protein